MQTISQIRKLGELIRQHKKEISNESLVSLEQYRVGHKEALAEVYQQMCTLAYRIHDGAICTYRIKRIESILSKLWRFPKMKLDTMGDIAGCRCILSTNKQVYELSNQIKSRMTIFRERDYIKQPERTGYRSVHLYVKDATKRSVEIQLRTRQHHNWATLVEISDLLYDLRMKEGISRTPLVRLHYLLSNSELLPSIRKRAIIRLLKRYKYFERLSEALTANYLEVRKQWVDVESEPNHSYFLIEAQRDVAPIVNSFSSFQSAEAEYFKRFTVGAAANRVLAFLPNASFKKLSLAYSNYMLTYHQFIYDCFSILESLIVDDIRNRKYRKFRSDYAYYLYLNKTHIDNIRKEIDSVNSTTKNIKGRRIKEWIGDIRNDLTERNTKSSDLVRIMGRALPSDSISRIIIRKIFDNLHSKYKEN